MARPRLAIGELGKVTLEKQPDGRYIARCRFRGQDGKTRQAQARGRNKTTAERSLKQRVKDRIGDRGSELGGDTRLVILAEKWWATIEQRCALHHSHHDYLNPDTRREYLRYKNRVVEAFGDLALRECTLQRLEAVLEEMSGHQHRTKAELKRTLVGMFNLAVRFNAMTHNPAKDIELGRAISKQPRALTMEELADMRARIHAYENSGGAAAPRPLGKGKGGRPRAKYLANVFDLQLALGCRIGELLSLQWEQDIAGLDSIRTLADLEAPDAPKVQVTIQSTLKHRSRAESERLGLPAGLYRQEHTKTSAGHRVVTLPPFGIEVLFRLREARADDVPWTFVSSVGTPLNPSNVRNKLREARGEEYEWVTPHTLRRTAITQVVSATGSFMAASSMAGHASSVITESAYTDRKQIAVDTSVWMESLAPRPEKVFQNVG